MKNIVFTYDSWKNGEKGEACASILVDDERAAQLDAAFNNPTTLYKTQVLILKGQAERFCDACEDFRGRNYAVDSIKCVEVKEV